MNWISINQDLPANGTLCWAFIPGKGIILRLYEEDSFNLGESDFEVTHWQAFSKPQYPHLNALLQNLLSTSQADHHTGLCSSVLTKNLAS